METKYRYSETSKYAMLHIQFIFLAKNILIEQKTSDFPFLKTDFCHTV